MDSCKKKEQTVAAVVFGWHGVNEEQVSLQLYEVVE